MIVTIHGLKYQRSGLLSVMPRSVRGGRARVLAALLMILLVGSHLLQLLVESCDSSGSVKINLRSKILDHLFDSPEAGAYVRGDLLPQEPRTRRHAC